MKNIIKVLLVRCEYRWQYNALN